MIGSPIGHSRSPALHRAAYHHLGLDCSYEAIEVTPQDLGRVVDQVRADPAWCGLSVTMPHKRALVELVDQLSPQAAVLGVLNTVTIDGAGPDRILTGHNTDVAGIVGALRYGGVASAPSSAVILGGGGTAAASLGALHLLGADQATVVVRSTERAAALQDLGRTLDLRVELSEWSGVMDRVQNADVVISTLPPRGADELARELRATVPPPAPSPPVLLDVAYDPWPSAFAGVWESRGGVIVPGLEMLIYQAVEQVRLFSAGAFTDHSGVLKVMCDAVGAPPR